MGYYRVIYHENGMGKIISKYYFIQKQIESLLYDKWINVNHTRKRDGKLSIHKFYDYKDAKKHAEDVLKLKSCCFISSNTMGTLKTLSL